MVRPKRNMALFRQNIAEAAFAILLEADSEALTMINLAKRLDMSVGNVYKCFESKDEVLLLVFTRFYRELNEVLSAHEGDQLPVLLNDYMSFALSRFNLYALVMQKPLWYQSFRHTGLAPLGFSLQLQMLRALAKARRIVRVSLAKEGIVLAPEALSSRLVFLFNSLHGLLMNRHTGMMSGMNLDLEALLPEQLSWLQRALTFH